MRIHRSMSAGSKRILLLSLVVTAVFSLLPISSHASVDWTEGFEYANDAALDAVWDTSCLGNPGVSTTRPHSGSKSLKEVFRGVAGVDSGAGGCFIGRNLPALSDTLYTRFYMFMENFTVNSTGTKITFHGPVGAYPSFWWIMPFGSASMSVSLQGIDAGNGTTTTINLYGAQIPQNQWVCLETRITMSTPGVADGIIQSWINGTASINVTNQRLRPATAIGLSSPTAKFKLVTLYTQHGVGTIYYDDYAVSRDARIGCSGSPPTNDTNPPASPSGLVVR